MSNVTDQVLSFINSVPRVRMDTRCNGKVVSILMNNTISLDLPRGCGKTATLHKLQTMLPGSILVTNDLYAVARAQNTHMVYSLTNWLQYSCRGTRTIVSYLLLDEVDLGSIIPILHKYSWHFCPNLVIVRLGTPMAR